MTEKRAPWLKWYPSDWRADPKLRMCSLAARGLWIEMLGYMHEADPYGHLIISGVVPTDEELSVLVGAPVAMVRKGKEELEAKGVYSRTPDGVLYSRRMVRDKAKADKDRANGKGGGNPTLKAAPKPQEKTAPLTDGVNPQDKAQKPEARDQKPEPSPPPPSPEPRPASNRPEVAVVDEFLRLRREIFPNESRLPAPVLTLENQARQWLEQQMPPGLLLEVVERVMRDNAKKGQSAPTHFGFCRLSLETAMTNHLLEVPDFLKRTATQTDPVSEAQAQAFIAAMEAWDRGGKIGPAPKRSDFDRQHGEAA